MTNTALPPTVAEELDRKSLIELERITHGLGTRQVGLVDAAASVQTIWDIGAGLLPKETMEIVAKLSTSLAARLKEKQPATQIALLTGAPGGCIVIARVGARVDVTSWVGSQGGRKTFNAPANAIHPEQWASEEFGRQFLTYVKQGFTIAFHQ